MATFWEVTFERRVEFEKDPATQKDGDVGEGVWGGGRQSRGPSGHGLSMFKEHNGGQCVWGKWVTEPGRE